jgi:hypothetical protein
MTERLAEQAKGRMTNQTAVKKSGWAAVESWDRTWKAHHIPMWFKKRIRLNAIKDGKWRPATRWGHTTVESLLPRDIFDHWGSVRCYGGRAMVAQPYGNHDQFAQRWAEEMGCKLESFTPGPWNEGTWCYVFFPERNL